MSKRTRYRRGRWKAQDERSGAMVNSDEMVREWNGRMVHRDNAESRQPQDYAKVVPDHQAVPWSRPEQSDNTSPYGIGAWAVGKTNVIPPDNVQPEENDVAFENWFQNVWPTKIKP
jgi:hypothetical protein